MWRIDRGKATGRQALCKRCHSAIESERRKVRIRALDQLQPVEPVPQAPIEDEDTAPGPPPELERMIPPTTPPPAVERYVVTYAQNATPVHEPFLAALRVYCEAQGAHLVVIPGRYKNPTSQWGEHHSHDEWWAPEIAGDLFAGRMSIGKLHVIGDVSIQPTADRPLTGLEPFAASGSVVFAHPKIQLRTIPGVERYYPRILTTTGAVTLPNYTASKAGKKAEPRHRIGALIIERDPHLFHVRHVQAGADGSFTDLDREYTPEGVRAAPRALALVLGDVHVAKADRLVLDATLYAPGSIANVLRPRTIVYHDTLDFDARNHHSRGLFTDRFDRVSGLKNDDVEAEVLDAIRFLDATPDYADPVVVRSNHDAAFDRWLRETDGREDPRNAGFWFAVWSAVMDARQAGTEWPDAFALVYRDRGAGRARFLRTDEPYEVGGSFLHFHGHVGLNGARGSLSSYARLGARLVIGHGHSPGILDDVYQGGACNLDHGYNETPSSWLTTHTILYASGARTLVSVIRGSWRAQ